jgi:hypothetical protein
MMVRLSALLTLALAFLLSSIAVPSHVVADRNVADDTPFVGDPKPDPMDIKVREAVDKGLKHLASIQNHNGSWSNDIGNKLGHGYIVNRNGHNRPHLGVTAIVCMAFMAAGHTPDRGEYSSNVSAGLAFVISTIDSETGWMSHQETRMYSHAFATMMLAEVYGQTRDPVVLRHLRNAVKFMVDSQNQQGAWRYVPDQQDSDMSVTVCQLQALRAAANVGVVIPDEAIEAARMYVRRSYIRTQHGSRTAPVGGARGGFKYQLDWDDRTTFTLTAAGVVALQSMGEYDSHTYTEEVAGRELEVTLDLRHSIDFLHRTRPDRAGVRLSPRTRHIPVYGFWYGHYYAAQAMYQYQFVNERMWTEWNRTNRENFLAMQHDNGAWTDEIGGWDPERNAYATAMACLVLSIPRGYLPIFQN